MCPSYFRVRIPEDNALRRFATWKHLSEIGPLIETNCTEAVRLASDDHGVWRGHAILVSKVEDWTLFQDLSGGLGDVSADAWREFASEDDFVFAGYNDAICWAKLVVVKGGRVLREFQDYKDEPESNINVGRLMDEHVPYTNWIAIAGFVDEDPLGFAEKGSLWIY